MAIPSAPAVISRACAWRGTWRGNPCGRCPIPTSFADLPARVQNGGGGGER